MARCLPTAARRAELTFREVTSSSAYRAVVTLHDATADGQPLARAAAHPGAHYQVDFGSGDEGRLNRVNEFRAIAALNPLLQLRPGNPRIRWPAEIQF